MDKVLKYEKNFILVNTFILSIAIIYLIIHFISKDTNLIIEISIILLVAIHILNILFFKVSYFNKTIIFFAMKTLSLVVLGLLMFNDNIYAISLSLLNYILICLEISIIIEIDNKLKRFLIYGSMILPAVICFIIDIYVDILEWDKFFCLIQFIIMMLAIYKIIDKHNSELKNKISNQTKLLVKSQLVNKELITSQDKVKAVNKEMSEQKHEMEKTNKRLNRIMAEMYIQNELLKYISSTLDIAQLMDLVTDSVVGALGVDTCSLIIYNPEEDDYYYKSKSNYDDHVIESLMESVQNGALDIYLNSKLPHINNDVNVDKYPFINKRPVRSLIIMPLIRNNDVYGLLFSEHASEDIFGDNNLQFFQSIATQLNIAVNNASLYAKMEDLANKDGLTNLYNRTYLQSRLNQLVEEYKINQDVLSVTLFDIDKFKSINDTYGHMFGDKVIKMVSRVANKYAHEYNGFAGRYGGEEFVVVLPNINLQDTKDIISKMHEEIKNEPNIINGEEVFINVSFGITAFPEFGKNGEDLLNRSDNAMYYSKEHGRGRITVDSAMFN